MSSGKKRKISKIYNVKRHVKSPVGKKHVNKSIKVHRIRKRNCKYRKVSDKYHNIKSDACQANHPDMMRKKGKKR